MWSCTYFWKTQVNCYAWWQQNRTKPYNLNYVCQCVRWKRPWISEIMGPSSRIIYISHVDNVLLLQNHLNQGCYDAIATWPQCRFMSPNVYFNCNAATRNYMEAQHLQLNLKLYELHGHSQYCRKYQQDIAFKYFFARSTSIISTISYICGQDSEVSSVTKILFGSAPKSAVLICGLDPI